MRRRDVVGLLGGTALAWPLAARAQQRTDRMRRIGVLMAVAEADPEGQARGSALRHGLQELGWNEGENLQIDWRWTSGEAVRLNEYAAELISFAPDLLITSGAPGLAALRRVTNSIPIVFVIVNDPVGQGFVPNLAHPGGNITGFTF